MSRDRSQNTREAPEVGPPGQPERQADQAADHDRAEPRDRETYADDIRADNSADENQSPADVPADLRARTTLDPSSGSNGHRADQIPEDHAATWRETSEKITFENKEIDVTHNAADGIWIEGLPGAPPTRIGDVLSSPEESGRSRLENFRQEVTKDADDLVDMGGKWTDLLRDTFGTPPATNSMTHSRVPEITATQPDHGINAGHGVEAFLTLAIVGAAGARKLHERLQRAWQH